MDISQIPDNIINFYKNKRTFKKIIVKRFKKEGWDISLKWVMFKDTKDLKINLKYQFKLSPDNLLQRLIYAFS